MGTLRNARETGDSGVERSSTTCVTYYVALPFLRNEQGDIVAGEAAEFHGPRAAIASAHSKARKHGGAIAFSRVGDPAVGEFDEATVLSSVGDVPADLADFCG
jgi:hypothetical protein